MRVSGKLPRRSPTALCSLRQMFTTCGSAIRGATDRRSMIE
jgi:hypothetical protein